jgi:hypothetical protein
MATLRKSIKIYALCYTPKQIRPVLYAVFSKNTQRRIFQQKHGVCLAKNTVYIRPTTPLNLSSDTVYRPPSRRLGRDHTWAYPSRRPDLSPWPGCGGRFSPRGGALGDKWLDRAGRVCPRLGPAKIKKGTSLEDELQHHVSWALSFFPLYP